MKSMDKSASAYFLVSTEDVITAYTNIRIPFAPNPCQAAFRESIRANLKAWQPCKNRILCAQYNCASAGAFDIENILFYNIGAAAFRSILTRETPVYFYRTLSNQKIYFKNTEFRDFYHYSFVPKGNLTYWWEHTLICKWTHVPLAKINSNAEALDYFLALKTHPELVNCFRNGINTILGLKLQVYLPKASNLPNIVCVMKSMIDGVICALHAPIGINAAEIGDLLNVDSGLFSSAKNTCLTEWCYIHPYLKSSVKRNPQDDKLDYVVIEPIITDAESPSFSGQLFSVLY